jgi:hypothetical protein
MRDYRTAAKMVVQKVGQWAGLVVQSAGHLDWKKAVPLAVPMVAQWD